QVNDGQVVAAVVPEDGRPVRLPVADVRGADAGRGGDHMVVGEHVTGRGEDDSGTGGATLLNAERGIDVDHGPVDRRGHGPQGERSAVRTIGTVVIRRGGPAVRPAAVG